MNMVMTAIPEAPPKPTAQQAHWWDALQRRDKARKAHKHTHARKAMSGMSSIGSGMGYPNYSSWYQQSYLPSYYSYGYQQVAQACPQGYQRKVLNISPYQTYCAPTQPPFYDYRAPYSAYGYGQGYSQYAPYGYPYSGPPGSSGLPVGPDQYLYYRTPQQCVSQGGLWDSFSQSCSGASGSPSAISPATPPSNAPSVIGYGTYSAAAILNGAGYEVWLVQDGSGYFNPPPGYDPRRIDIWTNNGVVERQAAG